MFEKNIVAVFFGLFVLICFQTEVNGQPYLTDLPKAPDWEFGWDHVSTLIKAKPATYFDKFDAKYNTQKVLNSWGYKARNVDEIKDLIPEPLYNIMKHPEIWGDYRINETAYIEIGGEHRKLYYEATEKYRGEPYLDETGYLCNYKAGIPFPDVDENDPQAAIKLVWNWIRRMKMDDDWSTDTVIDLVDRAGRHKYVVSENYKMQFQGRLVHSPKPLYTPNPNNIEYMYASVNKAPYNVAGTIARLNRYSLPNRDDDMWVYVPSLRRVRRMSTAERQDKMAGGKDYIWDGVETFDGAVGSYRFELIETKQMLQGLCCSFVHSNVRDGYLSGVDDYWQRGKTYVIRAIPKKPVNISEIIIYIDAREFRSNIGYVSDTKGRPWLYQQYPSGRNIDGDQRGVNACAIDLITRHSSKNWNTWAKYATGLVPDNFLFEELKKKYLVR